MVVGVDLGVVGQGGLVVKHVGVRRRAAAGQLVDERGVAASAGPGQGVGVEDAVGLARGDHLADADVGAVQLRVLLGSQDAEDGAVRLAQEIDLVRLSRVSWKLRWRSPA